MGIRRVVRVSPSCAVRGGVLAVGTEKGQEPKGTEKETETGTGQQGTETETRQEEEQREKEKAGADHARKGTVTEAETGKEEEGPTHRRERREERLASAGNGDGKGRMRGKVRRGYSRSSATLCCRMSGRIRWYSSTGTTLLVLQNEVTPPPLPPL